jgi:hypothetical protein
MNYTFFFILIILVLFEAAVVKFVYNLYKDQVKENEKLKSVLLPNKTHSQPPYNTNQYKQQQKQFAEVINLADHR